MSSGQKIKSLSCCAIIVTRDNTIAIHAVESHYSIAVLQVLHISVAYAVPKENVC